MSVEWNHLGGLIGTGHVEQTAPSGMHNRNVWAAFHNYRASRDTLEVAEDRLGRRVDVQQPTDAEFPSGGSVYPIAML